MDRPLYKLPNHLLIEAYQKGIQLGVNNEFIVILYKEIKSRNLSILQNRKQNIAN